MDPVVIIGTGIAGYTLAREFRKLDPETPLVLISEDDGRSYPKPMLSNALAKRKTADQIALFDADAMADKLDAQILVHTRVINIEDETNTLTITGEKSLRYSQLVLAVGASPIQIPIKGDGADDVLSINNLIDYEVFRSKLDKAKHVAIIGPGLIGCEFANDLNNVDSTVSIIGPNTLPMDNVLPDRIAKELKSSLEDMGVNWYLATTTSHISKSGAGYKITLSNGTTIEADIVISAVGLRPNTELAKHAGLAVNRGIVTDDLLRTSSRTIFAIGDCAEVVGHSLLFIAPIMAAAKALAKTLTGELTAVKYAAMPVAVKTPCYPLIIAPPPRDSLGEWKYDVAPTGVGIKGMFLGANKQLLGFVLSGDMVSEKQSMSKLLPDLLN